MKLGFLNDTHFGARGDSQLFFDYFIRFFEEEFFPYIKKNNIDTIIHAGDLLDRRKFVNFSILHQIRTRFIDVLEKNNIKMYCILGNHDVYYRNTNKVNSMSELFGNSPALEIYEEPTVVNFDGLDIALLPWVNKENNEDAVDFIKTAAAPILIGHLELYGYDVIRGVKYNEGMDAKLFSRYEQVFTGHFHCRQEHGNIYYLGTQYQITFSDLHETKGFHVYDTDTREIEFIENPHKMFHSLLYNDKDGPVSINKLDYLKDSYVKLFVEHKEHPYSFDRYMDNLYDVGVAKITVVEELNNSNWTKEEIVDMSQDTVTLINNEIDIMDEVKDKEKMKRLIKDLYMESLSL
ncbi:MAG: metallophosphoesterase [Proteobacteria bacterium]|nr:metallophosphoesterase [Pseudomonadota bacterium]